MWQQCWLSKLLSGTQRRACVFAVTGVPDLSLCSITTGFDSALLQLPCCWLLARQCLSTPQEPPNRHSTTCQVAAAVSDMEFMYMQFGTQYVPASHLHARPVESKVCWTTWQLPGRVARHSSRCLLGVSSNINPPTQPGSNQLSHAWC